MDNEQPTMMDILIEVHLGLERQGPGSPEMTQKALGFVDDLGSITKVADLACGTGGQTLVLAQNISSSIVGLDICPDFIKVFNDNAQRLGYKERVTGVVGSMEDLPFQKEEFDLIWSEGAIDNLGFEKGLSYWGGFLKKNGYMAVTCPSWLGNEYPEEVERLWVDAGSGLDTTGHNISVMQKAGYHFVAAFTLPDSNWTENYFVPREAAGKALREKYAGNKMVEDYLDGDKLEVELFSKYSRHYGYVFYIGKKL